MRRLIFATSFDMIFEIAGIRIAVHYDLSPDVYQQMFANYQAFVTSEHHTGHADISIKTQQDAKPPIKHLQKIFDNRKSLRVFRHDVDYYFSLHSKSLEPVLVAHVPQDFKTVSIYGNNMLPHNPHGTTALEDFIYVLLIRTLLTYFLSKKSGGVFHAAALAIDGKGYLFPGKSGAGKSTLIEQFRSQKSGTLLSDERIIVRKMDGAYEAFGTPWPGSSGMISNTSAPLAGIFFLRHGPMHTVQPISRQDALERLLPVVSIPWYDRKIVPRMLTFCEALISAVPVYELQFTPDVEVVDVFQEFVSA